MTNADTPNPATDRLTDPKPREQLERELFDARMENARLREAAKTAREEGIEAAAVLCDNDAAFGKTGEMQSMAESGWRYSVASSLAKEIRALKSTPTEEETTK